MAGPQDLGIALDNIFQSVLIRKIVIYTGWALLGLLIVALFLFVYYFVQYRYKITYPIMLYDLESDKQRGRILKFKKDYARKIKKNKIPMWHLFWSRKTIQPIDQKYILPGNRINLFRINEDGTSIPMPSLCLGEQYLDEEGNKKERPIQFEYLTNEMNAWALVELKDNAQSTITEDAQKRILGYSMIAIICVMIFATILMWLSLKYAGGIGDKLEVIKPNLAAIANTLSQTAPN